MNTDFRERVFMPIILPLGVLLGIAAVALSLSRILLAVPELVAVFLALAVAGYIILVAALVQSRPRISSRALGAGVALGLVALVASGVVAANAGMRDLHAEEEAAAGEGGQEEGAGQPVAPNTFVAVDIAYDAAPEMLPQEGEITLINEGDVEHNVVFDDLGEEPVVVAQPGESASANVSFPEPGTYRYHCSVPGHEALMNGEVTVE